MGGVGNNQRVEEKGVERGVDRRALGGSDEGVETKVKVGGEHGGERAGGGEDPDGNGKANKASGGTDRRNEGCEEAAREEADGEELGRLGHVGGGKGRDEGVEHGEVDEGRRGFGVVGFVGKEGDEQREKLLPAGGIGESGRLASGIYHIDAFSLHSISGNAFLDKKMIKGPRIGEYKYQGKLICKPQTYPSKRFAKAQICSSKVAYGYHELRDGTMVNMYWHGGRWCLGSARSSDLRDIRYSTEQTFGDLFEEAIGSYPEFGYNLLDKSRTYTIVFSHPAMHNSATHLSAWCYYDDIGIERMELKPLAHSIQSAQLDGLCEAIRASGLRPDAPFGYVFVALEPGHKTYVCGSPLWNIIKDCQNSKIPRDSHATRRAYIISRTLHIFRNLAALGEVPEDFSELLRACMPGVAEEVLALAGKSTSDLQIEQLAHLFEQTFGIPTPASEPPAVVYGAAAPKDADTEMTGRVTIRVKKPNKKRRGGKKSEWVARSPPAAPQMVDQSD